MKTLPDGEDFRARMNLLESPAEQLAAVDQFFESLAGRMDRMPALLDGPLATSDEEPVETAA